MRVSQIVHFYSSKNQGICSFLNLLKLIQYTGKITGFSFVNLIFEI